MSSTGSPQASPLAAPGAVIAGKYRLEGPIGAGGMGSVWAASHVSLGQPLAIKLISPDLVKSADALRRFDVEAKAAVQMRSRHIPQVYDNGLLEDGTPYIVMERLHGEPLLKRVERMGGIGLAESVSILAQCCRALTRAHALGIVHRDIKPDNIYLAQSDDDDSYIVKVLDFGVAKMPVTVQDPGAATRTGALIGTPAFMSPEQARGLPNVDARSDLYSLGLVAYQMLTGKQCFTALSLGDMLLQICALPLPSLLAAAPHLPPAMEAWFQKACGREPDDRFATATAWSEALVTASGLTAAELANAVTRWRPGSSSLPAAYGPSGGAPLVAAAASPSAPQITSTTGASAMTGTTGVSPSSRRQGAIFAGLLGLLTVALLASAVTLVARSRGVGEATAGASGSGAPSSAATTHDENAAPVVSSLDAGGADAASAHASGGAKPKPTVPVSPPTTAPANAGSVVTTPAAAAHPSSSYPPSSSPPSHAVPSAKPRTPAAPAPNDNAVGY